MQRALINTNILVVKGKKKVYKGKKKENYKGKKKYFGCPLIVVPE
jgi:hypothetical protein